MSIRKKSNAIKDLVKIRKGPLVFKNLLHSIRTTDEISQIKFAAKLAKALSHSEVLFVDKSLRNSFKKLI